MDDETYIYVKSDLNQLAGQKYYVKTILGRVPGKFKYIYVDKFASKVWWAICSWRKEHV